MVVSGKNTMELIIAARDRTGAAFSKVKSKMTKLGFTSDKVTAALKGAAKAGALIGGAAVVAGIVGSTKAFMDFEDAMANVRKTTGFTKEQITVLGEAINGLALQIPVAQTELASIAATAGQLGITGQKNILSFTETVAKMTTAFDMSADSVAIAAAKLTNIYNIPIEQVGNLGSAINVLGNTTAASESQLMAFSMSLGPTGQQLGFTATEALSLGASMVSIGMDASAAGTRLNRAFSMIGQNLDELAEFMGVTTEEFTASFEEMPMETFMSVLEKLSQVEGKLKANTVASQLFNEIGSKAIKGLTGDLDGLRTNLKNSAEGFEANTSLSEEFAAKTDTLKARFQLLKNSVTSLLIDIGGELAPTLNAIIDGVRNILPAVKDLVFEIGSGFGEMFESITRQAGGALDPLIKKLKEAGDKISSGLNFKTLLDDIGVFIGVGLNPLIRGFTWLIDKLGPLWELMGKGATLFHDLANALKTEEGRIDDIVDATNTLTKAKQELFDINEKLRGNVETLADALEKAGGWTTTLVDLEADAKIKTEALAVARLKASEAITVHGANSEIAKTAIENVKIAEEAATGATNDFNTAVSTAAGVLIDEGVATEGLAKAQLDFIETTEDVIDGQKNLETAVIDVETELEEAKAAPFNLGEAFADFGKLVARIFLAIPLKIAEAILSVQEIISGGLEKIGLGGFKKRLDADTEHIKKKIASIRKSLITNIEEPLLEDIPAASKKMKDAVTGGLNAIAAPAKRTKKSIDGVTDALEDAGDEAKETGETGEEAFENLEIVVDKVTGKIEVLTDNLGDTAKVFKDNEEAAKTLLNLDWDVFSKLESNLPNINSGIGDMTTAFTGLEVVLKENVENLESVKVSVAEIANLTAPFTEEGFMKGIKSIGTFANAIKDAGSAINTFGSLQEISIGGMINFSLHVRDMVSALQVLESQMKDLVPAFGEMDLLISNVTESFVYSSGRDLPLVADTYKAVLDGMTADTFTWGHVTYDITEGQWADFQKLYREAYATSKDETEAYHKATAEMQKKYGWAIPGIDSSYKNIGEALNRRLDATAYATYNVTDASMSYNDIIKIVMGTEEERLDTINRYIRTGPVISSQMDKQTNALAAQTAQLSKITDALEPYLKFMRTLNEIAALSTISTEELNSGLQSIEDTLINLGKVLSTFDLKSVMESLFGTKITEGDLVGQFTGGTTTGFKKVMAEYQGEFHDLIIYVDRLSSAIFDLVTAFDLFGKISESVLLDEVKLKEVFNDITTVMVNFSAEMTNFAPLLADGMKAMLSSAEPLITYFDANNAAVIKFNNTLSTFKTTIMHVVDVMDMLKKMSEMVLPSVDNLETGFDKAAEAVSRFDKALLKHVGAREGQWDMEKYSTSIFSIIKKFAKDWEMLSKGMDEDFKTFEEGVNIITTLIAGIATLVSAFESMKDVAMPSATEMGDVLDKIGKGVTEFTSVVKTEFPKITPLLTTFDTEWKLHKKTIDDTLPSLKEAISAYSTLISLAISLTRAYDSLAVKEGELAKIRVISAEDMAAAIKDLPKIISEMEELLGKAVWTGIITNLGTFKTKWDAISKGIKESVDSLSEVVSIFSSITSAATSLTDTFTEMEEIVVITADQIGTAFKDIPEIIGEVTEYITTEGFGKIETSLEELRKEYKLHSEALEASLKVFEKAINTFRILAEGVTSLNSAFTALKDVTIISSRDMEKAFSKIDTFIIRFTKALHTNIDSIAKALIDLDTEWSIHAKTMEKVMPSYSAATSDINTLISSISSLGSGLISLATTGSVTSTQFDAGFGALIKSVSNFAVSLKNNVGPLIDSLQELRRVWIENENVLVPLMRDFIIITKNLKSVADNANAMTESFRNINTGWVMLEKGFERLIKFIKTTVEAIKEFYTPEAATEVSTFIKDIGLVIESFQELNSKIEGALNDIKNKIRTSVDNIGTNIKSLENLNSTMFDSGQNIITSLINGMNSMQTTLAIAANGLAGTIKKYLGVESPTELGPLKNLEAWPRNLVQSFSKGIEAEMGGLNVSLGEMVAPAVVSGGGGGSGNRTSVSFIVHQNIKDRATADYSNRELEKLLKRHIPG